MWALENWFLWEDNALMFSSPSRYDSVKSGNPAYECVAAHPRIQDAFWLFELAELNELLAYYPLEVVNDSLLESAWRCDRSLRHDLKMRIGKVNGTFTLDAFGADELRHRSINLFIGYCDARLTEFKKEQAARQSTQEVAQKPIAERLSWLAGIGSFFVSFFK